jgi:hypothetical protein
MHFYLFSVRQARIHCGCTIGILSCNALWYSTPGPETLTVPPLACAAVGVVVGVVHTKCVVSIWILLLHAAPISSRAASARFRCSGSWMVPKQTRIPDVFVVVCVLTRTRFEGNVPPVVRSTSWIEYSVSNSRPDNLVEVFCSGDGIEARRCRFLYMSNERNLEVASCNGDHSSVMDVWVTFRSYIDSESLTQNVRAGRNLAYVQLWWLRGTFAKFFQYLILQ